MSQPVSCRRLPDSTGTALRRAGPAVASPTLIADLVLDVERQLQQFGQYLLRKHGPRVGRPLRRRLGPTVPGRADDDSTLGDRIQTFCDALAHDSQTPDWQVRQAEMALRIYFKDFLGITDWRRQPGQAAMGTNGNVDTLAAIEQLRARLRTC